MGFDPKGGNRDHRTFKGFSLGGLVGEILLFQWSKGGR